MKTNWRYLVLVAVVATVFGIGGGYLGANFPIIDIFPEATSEFQEYLASQDIPARGRNRLQQFLGNKWLKEHPSYSGQDGEDWKKAAEKAYIDCIARSVATGDVCYPPYP